jgi:imidazolonepropionase-like amidohydrolase
MRRSGPIETGISRVAAIKAGGLLILVTTLLAPGSVLAQTLFINDATVHTMSSQSVLQQADVLIRDGRIKSVGLNLSAPADATVIEAGGRPVTPGFFAGISALGLQDIPAEQATVDHALQTEAIRPEFDVTLAFNPNSNSIPVTRIEGYTWTMLGASRSGSIVGGQGQAVSLDGNYLSFLGDKLLFVDVGSDASEQSGGSRAAQWMLLMQAMDEARSEVRWAPDALLTVAGRKTLLAYSGSGTVIFNADRASDILQVLEFAQSQQINPVITGGTEAWMIADQLAEAGVPVLLNPLANLPDNFDQLGARLDNAAILNEAGVSVSFIIDSTEDSRNLRHAAGNAVANGLPYEAALAGLTSNPAIIFGLGEDMGTLAENSRADLVIWSGDPLEVTSTAEQVIIAGKLIPMVSRQTLLRERYLPENPDMPRAYIKP